MVNGCELFITDDEERLIREAILRFDRKGYRLVAAYPHVTHQQVNPSHPTIKVNVTMSVGLVFIKETSG